MPHSADYVSIRQHDILNWIYERCPDGVFDNNGARQTARVLHNRGFVRISGRRDTWRAVITEQGIAVLAREKKRVTAERERKRHEAERRAASEEREHQAKATADEVLREVVDHEGRLEVGTRFATDQLVDIELRAAQSPQLPRGKSLTHEPIKMDESLGFVLYLEPSFVDLIEPKPVHVPGQLRSPHALTTAFRTKRANVSTASLQRAARIVEAIVTTAQARGWSVRKCSQGYYRGGTADEVCDLTIRADDASIDLLIGERDARHPKARPYVEDNDYFTGASKTVANRSFEPSGRLLLSGWFGHHDDQPSLSFADGDQQLEAQLPELFRAIDVRQAQRRWAWQEHERKHAIKQQRWDEIFAEAKVGLANDRLAAQLDEELERRRSAIEMRQYAEELEHAAEPLVGNAKNAAQEWIGWIRGHADDLDPRNETIVKKPIGQITYNDIDPYMRGWSRWRP